MYNEDRKKKYIRYLAKDRGDLWLSVAAEDVFTKTEKIEADLGADLCEWPTGYAESAFSSPSYSPFPVRFYQYLTIVLSYTAWCRSFEDVPINREILNIRPKGSDAVRRRMVSGEDDLQNKLDLIFGDEHADTFDTIIRAFAWLSFAGIRTKDMEYVKKSDVDFSVPAVVFHERFHTLSHLALYSLRFAAESETLVSLRSAERVRRVEGDALSRNDFGTVGGDMMERIFQKRSKASDREESETLVTRPVLSFESILLSGVYCDMRHEEMRRRPTDNIMRQFHQDYAEAVRGKKTDKTASRRITGVSREDDLDALAEGYCLWKLAFLPTAD